MKYFYFLIFMFLFIHQTSFAQSVLHSCGADSIHNANTIYGNVMDIDGNNYKTVVIGNQTWMAENLKTSRFCNGATIPNVSSSSDWISAINTQSGASCWFNNDSVANHCPHGKLYNWHIVSDIRKVCPVGWHVPSSNEWIDLVNYIDPNGGGVNGGLIVGKPLKSTSTRYWQDNSSTFSDNLKGFSGIGSGFRENSGNFLSFNTGALFWSSSVSMLPNQVFYYAFRNNGTAIVISYGPKETGMTIRCIKDSSSTTLSNSMIEIDLFKVYPNPASTEINITSSNSTDYYVELINSLGEIIYSDNNTTKINCTSFSRGVYSIIIKSNSSVLNYRVLLQ